MSNFWKKFRKLQKRVEVGKPLSQWTAIKEWSNDKFRHTTKDKQPHSYKSHNSAEVIVNSLSDGDGYDDEENISENGIEEAYLFSSDSK